MAILTTGSTINLTANTDVGAFQQSSGTLTGLGNLTILGNLSWSGGTMSGTGTTSVAGTGSAISGTATKTLSRTLSNTGTITFSSPDLEGLFFGSTGTTSGVLNNSGTFNVTAGGDFALSGTALAQAINNLGTWNVSGAGTSNVTSIDFNNTGTLNVNSGIFDLGGGSSGSTTGDFNIASGATLRLGGGNFSLAASADVAGGGAMVFETGGTTTIAGTYNITGASTFSGGTANFNAAVASLGSGGLMVNGGIVNFNAPIPAMNGALTISSGAANFNSNDINASAITLSGGTLGGSASVSTSGNLTWSGGTMAGTGTTSVAGLGSTISGTATKTLSRTLSNTGTITFSSPDLEGLFFGSTGTTSGVLNNSGTFNVTAGGDFALSGTALAQAINNSGTWNVSGAGTSNVTSIDFNNTGTLNVNSGIFDLGGGSSGSTTGDFNIASGATLRLGGGNFSLAASADVAGGGAMVFETGGTTTIGGTYNVTGTSTFTGGTVNFNALVTSLGSGLTVNGGTVNFNAAIPAVLNGALTISAGAANFNSNDTGVSAITLSGGTLGGSASVSTSGNLTWSGGTMAGTGTTSVAGLGSTISGTATKTLSRTLSNTGTITFSSPDLEGLFFGSTGTTSGVLNNSGTFNVTAGGDFALSGTALAQAINNSGTWNVSGAGTSNVTSIDFNNTGTLNVNSGIFDLGGGSSGSTTGDFNIASGATLRLGGGNFSLAASADVAGGGAMVFETGGTTTIGGTYNVTGTSTFTGGTVNFNALVTSLGSGLTVNGGTVNFNAAVTAGTISLSSGTLGGTGAVSASGLFTWSGGTMSGSGVTNANGGLLMNGSGVALNGRTLNLPAGQTATMSGTTAAITFSNGARFNNAGTFLAQSNATSDFANGGGAASLFNNTGTFTRDTNTGDFNIAVPVANTGTINLVTSTLILSAGFTQADSGRVLGGRMLNLTGGTVLAGGAITANVSNSGAILSPGESGAGDLMIDGNYVQTAGGTLRIEVGGVNAGQFDKLSISGTAAFAGTLNVALLGGFVVPTGQQYNVLTYGPRTGTFTLTGAPGFSQSYQATDLDLTRAGVNYTWDAGGGVDTSWFNRLNWGPDGIPTAGDGTTLSSSATITLPSAAVVGSFTQSAGIVTGAGTLTADSFSWTGGTQSGTGSTAVTTGGSFNVSGTGQKILTERTLNQGGAGVWTGTGNLQIANGAIFNNSGSFDIQNAARLEVLAGGAEPRLVNSGTLQKTASTGTTTFNDVRFENSGTLRLSAGMLSLTGAAASFTQSGGATTLSGGSLSAVPVLTFNGGAFSGVGTISGNVFNAGATVQPGGTDAVGTIAITGTYTQGSGGTLAVEIGGTTAGTEHDQLSVGNIATLGGTLGAALINGFTPGESDVFNVIGAGTRSGTFSTLSAPGSLALTYTATQARIVSSAAPPSLSINDVSVAEGDSGTLTASFSISLSVPSSQPVTVQYATGDGTATAPEDYAAMALTTVTFAPGEIAKTVSIAVSGDTLVEPDEVFAVNLSDPTNATIGDAQGQGTIRNDDGLVLPTLSINDVSVTEGTSGTVAGSFTISLSAPSSQPVTVQYATGDGTANAPEDYAAVALTTVTFAPGEVTKTVSVNVNGDSAVEPDETFFVNLSNPTNATLLDPRGQGTIRNDDGVVLPTLSINDVSVAEGASGTVIASFMISLSAPSSQPVTVQYATADGTATTPEDYAAVALTTVTFAPGETLKMVSVTVSGDTLVEPDEVFAVNLSNPTNATILDAQGQATIHNDDASAYVWDAGGGTDTSWFNRLNWAPDGIPSAADSATLLSSATIMLPGPASVASFVQLAGVLTGPGRLTASTFTWSGGTQDGTGATSAGGSLLIDGTAVKVLAQRTLENLGAGVWKDAGNVQLSQGAVFTNDGRFVIQNDASLEASGAGQASFVNRGTLEKTAGTGTTNFIDLSVENSGTFRLESGTIFLSGASASFTQTAGTTELSGGNFSATGETPLMFTRGVLSGSGTIAASVVNTGAIVRPGGAAVAGTLSIEGDYIQGAQGTLVIELGTAANDQLVVGGAAVLGGTLEVDTIGGFTIPDVSSFSVIAYTSFNGAFAALDAPSGVSAVPGASTLTLNAEAAPGQRSRTVTDVDGDLVTLTVNKGSIPNDALTLGPNGELQVIDLRAVGNLLEGATFTVDVQQAGGGDGAVNVGAIDATGMNLARVRVSGDLGQIDIGTADPRKSALKSLTVGSLGVMGAAMQPAGTENPLLTEVTGALGKLTVQRDVMNAIVEVSSKLGKVVIGGSLMDTQTAALRKLGSASIGVFQNGGLPNVGSGPGTIFAPEMGSVTVMGDVQGGEIAAETKIKIVKIRRNLISDDPEQQAILRVGASVSKVLITGDVRNALILAGYNKDLEAKNPDASIGKVVVNGDWTASSVVAGVTDPSHDGFGVGDAVITPDPTPSLLSRIASVIIKGTASGSATPTDHSAVTAQKIGTLRIADEKVPLTSASDDILLDPLRLNFRAVEI